MLLVVCADAPPADLDWARLKSVREANRAKIQMALVVAPPRAVLSAAQRAEIAAFMKATDSGLTIITDSALNRGIVLALGMLGLKVRAYAPSEVAQALNHCGFSAPRALEMRRRIDTLTAQLLEGPRIGAPFPPTHP